MYLVIKVSDKAQKYIKNTEKRPYGVGLLVAGYDNHHTHIYETIPTGQYLEYEAQAIGARYQFFHFYKTYLQKYYQEFNNLDLIQLIIHGLNALKSSSK